MSISIAHLDTERRYWHALLKPLAEKNGLLWDVQCDFALGTVALKLVHPNDAILAKGAHKNLDPSLISRVDVDRKKRSEETIMNEIEKEIKIRTANR